MFDFSSALEKALILILWKSNFEPLISRKIDAGYASG